MLTSNSSNLSLTRLPLSRLWLPIMRSAPSRISRQSLKWRMHTVLSFIQMPCRRLGICTSMYRKWALICSPSPAIVLRPKGNWCTLYLRKGIALEPLNPLAADRSAVFPPGRKCGWYRWSGTGNRRCDRSHLDEKMGYVKKLTDRLVKGIMDKIPYTHLHWRSGQSSARHCFLRIRSH